MMRVCSWVRSYKHATAEGENTTRGSGMLSGKFLKKSSLKWSKRETLKGGRLELSLSSFSLELVLGVFTNMRTISPLADSCVDNVLLQTSAVRYCSLLSWHLPWKIKMKMTFNQSRCLNSSTTFSRVSNTRAVV